MEVVLIVNPFASAVTEDRVRAVERELGRAATVRTLLTERPGHGAVLAAAAVGDALVVYSGDGGFNEALNGVPAGLPLGFLPGGRTSVMPRALGLPRDPVAAARALAEALEQRRTRTISLGRVNGRRFGFSAGIGLDGELVRRVDALGRREDGRRPGDAAYIAAINVKQQVPFGYYINLEDVMAGLRRIAKEGKHVLPTHDAEVYKLYPEGVS